MSEKDDLDLLLDAALRSYADPGPDSGLEQRILRRIQSRILARIAEGAAGATQRPRRMRWLWAAASSLVAASLLLFVVVAPWRNAPPPTIDTETSNKSHPPAEPGVTRTFTPSSSSHTHRSKARRRSDAEPASTPKLAVFPAPTPLSAQERALVRLVAGASAEQRKDLMASQQTTPPLHIAAIAIPLIEPPQTGKE